MQQLSRHEIHPSRRGRLLLYSVNAAHVRGILAALHRLPHRDPLRPSAHALRPTRRLQGDLRQARTCFDHLGGAAGVYLMNELLRRRWLVRREDRGRSGYVLTMRGAQGLMRLRVNVIWAQRRRRRFALGCPDWSLRRAHLGGALGAALLVGLMQVGLVRRDGNSRHVLLRQSLGSWLAESDRRAAAFRRASGRGVRGLR